MIHLSSLNNCVALTRAKMEMVSLLLGSIKKGDMKFLIDLDTCSQIPIHPDSRLFLQISLNGKVFQFKVCFSLSTAPQVFTRVFFLVPERAYWMGIWLLCYLDDWLVIVESTRCL